MRSFAPALVALFLIAGFALAQQPERPDLKGTKVTGPHTAFSLIVPEGWQHETFESKVDKPDEKFEFRVEVLGERLLPTDNLNLWWYEGKLEAIEKGSVSLHRVDLAREMTPDAFLDAVTNDPERPKDALVTLTQVGKYVGLKVTTTVEDITIQTVIIANGKAAYIAHLRGPKDSVKEQADKFAALLATLDAPDVKPARLDETLGGKPPETEEPLKPGEIKSKSGSFRVTVPQGWKYSIYDNPDDKPNAKLIMQVAPLAGRANITDNINFWWSGETENMFLGVASLHRLEAVEGEAPSAKAVADAIRQSGQLPQGMEANLVQLGDYVVVLVGGPVQNVFYGAGVIIPQGKTVYLASILGPMTAVQPQWQSFMQLVSSLKAPDLKPQKLEDLQ